MWCCLSIGVFVCSLWRCIVVNLWGCVCVCCWTYYEHMCIIDSTYVCVCVHLYAVYCVHWWVYVCECVSKCVWVCVSKCVWVCVCVCVCEYVSVWCLPLVYVQWGAATHSNIVPKHTVHYTCILVLCCTVTCTCVQRVLLCLPASMVESFCSCCLPSKGSRLSMLLLLAASAWVFCWTRVWILLCLMSHQMVVQCDNLLTTGVSTNTAAQTRVTCTQVFLPFI